MGKFNFTEEQLHIIDEYCKNDMKKLKKLCNPIIIRIGGLSDKDYDGVYSLAQWILLKNVTKYDKNNEKECSFNTFLFHIMERRLYDTYIRNRNRKKRSNTKIDKKGNTIYIPDISLDAPSPDCIDILERLASDNNVEDKVFCEIEEYSQEMKEYLNKLSKVQIKVLELLADEYSKEEIEDILQIDSVLYNDSIAAITLEKNRRCIRSLIRRNTSC